MDWSMLTEMAVQMMRLSLFRDDRQAAIRTGPAGNRDDDNRPSFLVAGLSAFLRNDRSALSSYDLPEYLPLLQSDNIHNLIGSAPIFLPNDVEPLWQRYWASVDRNEDNLVKDLLNFLMPGRAPRHEPWSAMPNRLPPRALLPPSVLGGVLGSDSQTSFMEGSSAPALVPFYDASVSEPDVSSGDLQDDSAFSDFDDPAISVPDDSSAFASADPPILVPYYLTASELKDLRAFVVEASWGIAMEATLGLSLPSPDRMLALLQDMVDRFHAAGLALSDFADVMPQPPSLSEALQMDMALGLGLDVRRVMRTTNFLIWTDWGILKDSPEVQSQPADRQSVALSVLEIVWTMTGYQACFDPRDRVFGTFGFFGEELPSEFSLSHKMGLDELYSTFCRYLLVESALHSDVGVLPHWWPTLQRATQAGKRSSLPSWCPDLQQHVDDIYKPFEGAISTYGQQCQPRFKAGAERPIRVGRGLNWSQIVFRGRLFDSVLSIHSAYPWTPDILWETSGSPRTRATLFVFLYGVALWESELATRVAEAPVGDAMPSNIFEAYWETLIGNGWVGDSSLTRQDFLDFQIGLRRLRDLLDRTGIIER